MMTVRNLERQWNAKQFTRMLAELLVARPEASFSFDPQSSPTVRTAALGLIRLEELDQSHVPLAGKLVRTLLAMQESDGGWGDPAVTALCLRALFCSKGDGQAIRNGLAYLANLQKPDGLWPAVPMRRMPGDAAVSAFVLTQIGQQPQFRAAVMIDQTMLWFESHARSLDAESSRSWERARIRLGSRRATAKAAGMQSELLMLS